jgi:hypothetical protein
VPKNPKPLVHEDADVEVGLRACGRAADRKEAAAWSQRFEEFD